MAVSLLHLFHSAQPDDPDATLIRPSNWNAQHALTGTPGAILGFDGSGNAIEISGSGVPGAPNHSIQYNNSGAFGGDANLTWTPGTGLQDKLSAVLGNSATFGTVNWYIGSTTPLYTGFSFTTPSVLIVQPYYNGDLSVTDFNSAAASYPTVQHTGTAGAAASAGDFSITTNPESTGPFDFNTAVNAQNLYAGAGACQFMYGAFVAAAFSPPTTRTDTMGVIGIYGLAETQNICNNTSVYGLWGEAHLSAPNSTAAQLVGLYANTTLDATTSHTPLAVSIWAAATLYGAIGSTATSAYGVYIEDQTSANATNSWNLYSFGALSQNTFEGKLNLGLPGGNTGIINFDGKTSGVVKLSVQDAAGSWTMKLPTTAGTNLYVLQTDGSGNTSWVPQTGGGAVSSVTGTGAITVSPTTGATVVSVATATSSSLGVVQVDGTSVTISGGIITAHASGGTGTPGGTLGSVQFNNPLGSFDGATKFFISSGNPKVTTGGAYIYDTGNAIRAITSLGNWFFADAGNLTMTGTTNTAIGTGALASTTTGTGNVGFGSSAGLLLTTGNSNVFIGSNAGGGATVTSANNIGFGNQALQFVTTGAGNVAEGAQALQNCTTASGNMAEGQGSLSSLTTGSGTFGGGSNVAIGVSALLACNADANTALGGSSGGACTSGDANTFIGYRAGVSVTSGARNVIVSSDLLFTGLGVTTGSFNTILGVNSNISGTVISTGSHNLILGDGINPGSNVSSCIIIGCNGVNHLDYNLTTASTWTTHSDLAVPNGKVMTGPSTTSYPAINIASGVAPTSPADGDYWYDGTHLNFRHGGTTTDILASTGGGVTSGTMTANAAVYATGASAIASNASALTNGQILIGSTSATPVQATIATSGSGISVTNGAGTITLANTGVTSAVAGTGIGVSGATGAVTISNTGVTSAVAGTGISVSGATGAVTVSLVTPVIVANGGSGAGTFTAHGLILGEGTSAFGVTAVGTTNQILIGQSAADPIWATTLPSAALPNYTGDVTSTGTVNTLVNIPTGTTAAGFILHSNIAAPSNPASGKVSVYTDLTNLVLSSKNSAGTVSNTVVPATAGANQFATAISAAGVISFAQPSVSNLSGLPVTVAQGGTGVATLTAHGILIGEGTSNVAATAVGTTGQILIGQSAADPIWATTLPTAATPAYTGDVTSSAGGTVNTLASVITAGGPTGSSTVVPVITYDAKGRLTTVTTATIAAGTANVDPSPQRVVAVNAGSATMTGWNLVLDPAGALTSYAITLPSSPTNGQIAVIRSSQPISSLSWTTTPATAVAAPNTLAAGSRVEAIYISAVTSWYFGL